MNRLFGIAVTSLIALCALLLTPADTPAQQETVKHVIVMISDGWSINHVKATNYWHGVESQAYQNFPVCLFMSTYSQSGIEEAAPDPPYDPALAWTDFSYMLLHASESAATTTAMVTGVKTYDGRINVDSDGNKLFTVTDRASALGKSVGVVTSVPWSHATPAGFVAHNISRRNYAEIAQEMLASDAAVIMGCGNPDYDNNHQPVTPSAPNDWRYVGSQTQWNDFLTSNTDWALIHSRDEFRALMVNPNPPPRVLGVPQCRLTLQQRRTTVAGEESNGSALPYTAPLNDVPTLEQMTRGALNVLDENPRGFLLMVEGGAVDWAGHACQLGRMIEEQTEFNSAVDAVIAWVDSISNWDETLVIVTGDHECGYLWGPDSGPPHTFNKIVDSGAGNLPGAQFYSDTHSNSLIPLFAKGVAALRFDFYADEIDPVRGRYIDNTEVARVIFDYYGAPD